MQVAAVQTAQPRGDWESPEPREAVAAVRAVFGGCYPGYRAAHARGTVVRGKFIPAGGARDLTTAQFMRQGPIDVTARFSSASGDPSKPDNTRDPRGMAVRFHPPGGDLTDIVAISLPCFFVKTPQDFQMLSQALRRGRFLPFQLLELLRFVAGHPESWKGLRRARPQPPPSYANCRYNALHTFVWEDANHIRRYVRYSWRPGDGEASLTGREARKLPRDYLYQDLHDRLGRRPARPIRFTFEVQLASQEDVREKRIGDPTKVWPQSRDRILPATVDAVDDSTLHKTKARVLSAGVLELNDLADPLEQLRFDPVPRVDGLEPSDDEILLFRPPAYEVSAQQRSEHDCGQR